MFFFIILFIVRMLFFVAVEYPRHYSLPATLDFINESHIIDLDDENSCYILRPGMTLLQKDPDFPTSPQSLAYGAPEGSVMHVSETKFDPNPHWGECRHYKGYVITKNGPKEWVLTSVEE